MPYTFLGWLFKTHSWLKTWMGESRINWFRTFFRKIVGNLQTWSSQKNKQPMRKNNLKKIQAWWDDLEMIPHMTLAMTGCITLSIELIKLRRGESRRSKSLLWVHNIPRTSLCNGGNFGLNKIFFRLFFSRLGCLFYCEDHIHCLAIFIRSSNMVHFIYFNSIFKEQFSLNSL